MFRWKGTATTGAVAEHYPTNNAFKISSVSTPRGATTFPCANSHRDWRLFAGPPHGTRGFCLIAVVSARRPDPQDTRHPRACARAGRHLERSHKDPVFRCLRRCERFVVLLQHRVVIRWCFIGQRCPAGHLLRRTQGAVTNCATLCSYGSAKSRGFAFSFTCAISWILRR